MNNAFIIEFGSSSLEFFVVQFATDIIRVEVEKKILRNVDKKCGEDDKYDVQFIENKKITRTLIIKCHVPNSDWSQYDSKIHNFYDSYAKALNMKKNWQLPLNPKGPGATTWKMQNKTKKITAEYESIVNPPSVFSKLFSDDELRAGGVEHSVDRSRNIDGSLNLEDLLINKFAASQFMIKLVLVGG
ncbi:hypothetical protein JTB14_016151 [Gonioctena quinquepunctata]|nr:hypothetical protein JTB14_016151 [Gonioctena quinquepunctata]